MKERPILFSGEMVRAILEGRKTQTRRIVKPQPVLHDFGGHRGICFAFVRPQTKPGYIAIGTDVIKTGDTAYLNRLPYGEPGDRLWVREAFYCDDYRYPEGPVEELKTALDYRASHDCNDWEAGCPCSDDEGRSSWRPSIHMPRWASRITLEVTGVRVERLRAISLDDCIAEGTPAPWPDNNPIDGYRALWEKINGKDSWITNPFVWVIEFRKIYGLHAGEPSAA